MVVSLTSTSPFEQRLYGSVPGYPHPFASPPYVSLLILLPYIKGAMHFLNSVGAELRVWLAGLYACEIIVPAE